MLKEIVVANKNYAVCAASNPQSLDKTAVKVIRLDCPSFLMPMRLVNIDNQLQLRYEILGGIRLSYMPMKMRKQELNQLLTQMITPFMDCADWFLDYRNIYLDRDYIMVDQNDYKVKYIYLPITEGKANTEERVLKFFSELVMEIDLEDDPAYITSVMRCIMGKEASLCALADMLKKQTEKTPFVPETPPALAPVKPEPIKPKPIVPEKNVQPEISQPFGSGQKYGENNLAGAIGAGLFGDDSDSKKKNKKETKKENKKESKPEKDKKSKGFFGKLLEGDKKPKNEPAVEKEELSLVVNAYQQPQMQSAPQAYDMEAAAGNFNTEIEDDDEIESTDTLRMRLESSAVDNVPELIELDMSKVCVVVGRVDKTGKMSADFNFDMSLTYIGRRHARFEKVGEDFFMIDLESKNHTYLNGEELLPNRRYPIHKGDRITFTKKYAITYRVC